MDKLESSYNKTPPKKELYNYTPKELRHAANWIDRDQGNQLILNTVSLFKKLSELNAELAVGPDNTGVISFTYNNKQIKRYFESAAEMSTAINLGPVDLMGTEPLFFKSDKGPLKAHIAETDSIKNTVIVYVPEINLTKMIYLNGAEKILCNGANGMTVGQMKIREVM